MSAYVRTWADVEREHPAATSAMKMLLERYEAAPCDSKAVSTCVRCNVVYLARWTADLLEIARARATDDALARSRTEGEG